MRKSWVEKRFDNLDEQGFPKPLAEDKLPETQLDASYNVEPGNLNELSTWQLMAEQGEMTEEALRQCSTLPFMEYEVSGLLDFEGLEEAKELLISPKKKRIEAGIDVMLSSQGLSFEQRRKNNKRRLERMEERKKGVKDTVEKMRHMAEAGYDSRQIAMSLIVPQMGKKVRAHQRKLSAAQKAKHKLRSAFLRKKAAAKAKAKAKLEEAAEPEECWED